MKVQTQTVADTRAVAVLRDAGIIHGTVEGPNRRSCLNPDALGRLRPLFAVLEQRGRRAP